MIDKRIIDNFPFPLGVDGCKIVVAAYMGSVSHGTQDSDQNSGFGIDDVDVMGAMFPPLPYMVGWGTFEQWDPKLDPASSLGELDCIFYDIRKLVRLWIKSNPNVLGLLWLKPEFIIHRTPAFDRFVEIRRSFSSKQGITTLRGYARGQMHDIDKGVYRGYMGAKRKAMVERFGFDCKHAAHTIRLLRMGIEFAHSGEYNVWRGDIDADELRAIKRGEWSRDRVLSEASDLLAELDVAEAKDLIPEKPDMDTINEVTLGVLYDHIFFP